MKTWTPEEIKAFRLFLAYSQEAFGELVGVSRGYVNYLEKGVRLPGKTLKLLLNHLEEEKKTKKKGVKDYGKTR